MPASAGSVLRLPMSRGMSISNQAAAVSYGYSSVQGNDKYVVDASLDGFLLCNEFGATAQGTDTTSFESVYLRVRHGAWLFGSVDAAGVNGSITGIKGVSYGAGELNLDACPADGTDCGAVRDQQDQLVMAGAALQCYVADGKGYSVADTRQLFGDGFDALAENGSNSWVSIVVTHYPVSTDDTFDYTITVTLPSVSQAEQTSSTSSLGSSQYVLKEGYDASVFSSCTTLLGGGQLISQSTVISRQCKMVNPSAQLPTDVPVVNAALFTNAITLDGDYSDNVAFGYPIVTGQQQ